MSMYRSWLTSWAISAIGKSGARSSGPIGSFVPGWMTGGSGTGRSAWMLYHCCGISLSLRNTLLVAIGSAPFLFVGGDIPGAIRRT